MAAKPKGTRILKAQICHQTIGPLNVPGSIGNVSGKPFNDALVFVERQINCQGGQKTLVGCQIKSRHALFLDKRECLETTVIIKSRTEP